MKMKFLLITFSLGLLILMSVSCKKVADSGNDNTNTDTTVNDITNDTTGHSIELWGTTVSGGTNNLGGIYRINGDGTGYKNVYSFNETGGNFVIGSLCEAPNGKLYGIAGKGGVDDAGTIFSFDPKTSVFKKIIDFGAILIITGGRGNSSSFILSEGKLWGSTFNRIFMVDPSTDAFKIVCDFSSDLLVDQSIGGIYWGGEPIDGKNGKLYIVSSLLGPGGGGVLYSFDKDTYQIDVLHEFLFEDTSGWMPSGSLCLDSKGNIYGTTIAVGPVIDSNTMDGCFYKYNIPSDTYTKIVSYGPNGLLGLTSGSVNNNILEMNENTIIGFTAFGGAYGGGTIYSYDIPSGNYKIEYNFGDINKDLFEGSNPIGITMTRNGLFYGNMLIGGSNDGSIPYNGSIIRYDPFTSTFKTIHGFKMTSENNPYSRVIEYINY